MRATVGAGIVTLVLFGCPLIAQQHAATRPDSEFHSAARWLQGFHHAEVPGRTTPTQVTITSRLDDLRFEAIKIERQAWLEDNFSAATDALAEASANLAFMAAIQERPSIARAGSRSPVYLLAFKDQTVRPALAYWVEGNTLHYIGLEGVPAQAPLDAVDRALTERLNRERQIDVRLP